MTATRIYIVIGNSGAYSDYSDWFVAAYWDEENARQHAQKAKEWADDIKHMERATRRDQSKRNPWDDQMMFIDDDVAYGVEEVDVFHDVSYYLLSQNPGDET